MTEDKYFVSLEDREVWDDFEQGLLDTYKKYPTVENAENILLHYKSYIGTHCRPCQALQDWIDSGLKAYLENDDPKIRNPIEKALGLSGIKGQKNSKDQEHATVHMYVWQRLFMGETKQHAFLSIADELKMGADKVRITFNDCSFTVEDKETGEELRFMDIEKYDRGINAWMLRVGRGLNPSESRIVCEVLNERRKAIEKNNPKSQSQVLPMHYSAELYRNQIKKSKDKK